MFAYRWTWNLTQHTWTTSQVTNFVPLLWHLKEKIVHRQYRSIRCTHPFFFFCFICFFFAACFVFFACLLVLLCVGACVVLISWSCVILGICFVRGDIFLGELYVLCWVFKHVMSYSPIVVNCACCVECLICNVLFSNTSCQLIVLSYHPQGRFEEVKSVSRAISA